MLEFGKMVNMTDPVVNLQLPAAPSTQPPKGLWDLFLIWFWLGAQSFGGGASTLILIHQACLRYEWMDESQFVRAWALSQISPGINLAKLTIIIGYQLRKWPGLLVCLAGLLLPSAGVTVLMTAGYAALRNQPWMQAVMRGILPATIGLSFTMSIQMGQSLLSNAYFEGRARLGVHAVLLVAGVVLAATGLFSPIAVMLLVGGATVIGLTFVPVKKKTESIRGG
jgi:chromate transporter